MNFLFGALLLIIILLPGVILRVSYLSTPYGKKTFRFSVVDELILSLIPTLILQGTGYAVTNYFIKGIDEKRLYYLFINNEKVFQDPLPDSHILFFFLYTLVLCAIAIYAGYLLRRRLQKKKLDIRFPFLRFYNDWHYIFRGLILDFPGHAGDSKNVDNVWVDVVTINKDDTYLYSGLLKEYVLTKDDGLDRIYLTNVQRRKLVVEQPGEETEEELELPDEPEEVIDYDIDFKDIESNDELAKQLEEMEKEVADEWYYMPGDYFVIPYSEIKNINISYYKEKILDNETG